MLGRDGEVDAADAADDGAQPELPLLDEVVARGAARPGTQPGPDISPEEAALCRRVAARLASEIDVIVQAHLEQALAAARREIRKRLKQHISITLPELIQDAAKQLDSDPD